MLPGCLFGRAGWLVCTLFDFVWPGTAIYAAAGQRSKPSVGGVGVTDFIVSLLVGYYTKGSSLPEGVTVYTGKGHVRTVYSCFCKLLAKMLLFLDKKNLLA